MDEVQPNEELKFLNWQKIVACIKEHGTPEKVWFEKIKDFSFTDYGARRNYSRFRISVRQIKELLGMSDKDVSTIMSDLVDKRFLKPKKDGQRIYGFMFLDNERANGIWVAIKKGKVD